MKSEPGIDEETATAYHEAGHAYAAVALHLGLSRVSIEPGDESQGRTHARALPRNWEERIIEASYSGPGGFDMEGRMRRWIERQVAFTLAGPVAEMHATGADHTEVGAGVTRLTPEQAEALSARTGGPVTAMITGGDYRAVMDLLLAVLAGDDEEMTPWWAWLEVRTRRLITGTYQWAQVERIARALVERKTLTTPQVRTILS